MNKKLFINKDFLKNKWTLRIFALILALVMWFYVNAAQNTNIERVLDVPLGFHNIPDNTAVSEKPSIIRVRVQGERDVVNDLLTRDINVYVDLQNASIGQNMAKVQTEKPNKVTIVSVYPVEVAVELEQLIEVQKSVDVFYSTEKPAEGYQYLDAVLNPSQVIIAGPKSKVEAIDSVYINAAIAGLTSNYAENLPVYVRDASGNNLNSWLTVEPSTVEVLIPIVTESAYKLAPISASISGEPADGYMVTRVIISPDLVGVYGDQAKLDEISYVYTAPINIAKAKGDISVKVDLVNTEGVELSLNQKINVLVKIEKITERTLENILISVENQNDDYNYKLEQNVAKVKVKGPESIVDELQANQINIEADVDGLKPGSYNIYLNGDMPSGISSMKIEPQTVNLQINNK